MQNLLWLDELESVTSQPLSTSSNERTLCIKFNPAWQQQNECSIKTWKVQPQISGWWIWAAILYNVIVKSRRIKNKKSNWWLQEYRQFILLLHDSQGQLVFGAVFTNKLSCIKLAEKKKKKQLWENCGEVSANATFELQVHCGFASSERPWTTSDASRYNLQPRRPVRVYHSRFILWWTVRKGSAHPSLIHSQSLGSIRSPVDFVFGDELNRVAEYSEAGLVLLWPVI